MPLCGSCRVPVASDIGPTGPHRWSARSAPNTNHVVVMTSLILSSADSRSSLQPTTPQRMRPFILFACLLFSLRATAQLPHPEEVRFLTEYAQYSLRTELTVTKVNAATNGYQRENRDAAASATREIANLRDELAGMLNQPTRHNLSMQEAGQPENRRLAYMTEAGNAMMSELGVLFRLPTRNELPLRRSLERYQAIRQILESEFRK